MKKVLLITRPLVPPWDEASKNFAYNLALYTKKVVIGVLTDSKSDIFPKNVRQLAVYTKGSLNFSQKLKLILLRRYIPQFDIVHYLLSPNASNALFTRLFLLKKGVKTIQTIATLQDKHYSRRKLKKLLFADLLITYSDFTKNKLAEMGFANTKRIYPGIDLKAYRPAKVSEKFKNSLGIKKGDFTVAYPGEYTRLGATDPLVEMLPELSKKIPALKFIFACRVKNKADATKKKEVIDKVNSMGLAEKVVYTDTVKDMSALYNATDVVIFPVRSMQGKFDVPLIIIEAMACAKPVIVSDLPVLSEFTSKDNAIVVQKDGNSQLLEEIVKLKDNPKLRQELGGRARDYVTANFDIIKVTEEYEAVYDSLT